MKTKLLLSLLLTYNFCLLSSQVPHGLNYQALACDVSGNPIRNNDLQVKISILSDTLIPVTVWEELHSSIKTNVHGIFSLVVGSGVRQPASSVAKFSDINWSGVPLFIKTQIYYQSAWKNMGSAKLWTVPYAMVANNLSGSVKKLAVTGETANMDEALFEVKNKTGQTVFAVYNEGVRVYVDDGAKGAKGGFAIGGFDMSKGAPQDYVVVSPDSIRMYINDKQGKGAKGGFAIGGFDMSKGGPASFLDVSTDASGIINPSQNRVLWYPIKNAFLAGRVLIEKPDSVGVNSFATGYESKAKGQYSQAMGYQAVARGEYSTSIGYQSIANKDNSFAFGQWALANNYESYAFGRGAIAEGFRSFAFGSAGVDSLGKKTGVAYAKGDYSFSIGLGSQALGDGSFAIGTADTASGWGAVAMGYKTTAKGASSTSIGSGTVASGVDAFAGGYQSQATFFHAFAFGKNNLASGHASVAMGTDTRSTGNETFAIGRSTVAEMGFSVAFGLKTQATNYCAMAIGSETIASGGDSFAGGYQSKTTESHAFAFGKNTLASGQASVAMGVKTMAMGFSSFAMGDSSIAGMNWAIALGYRTLANGYGSLAGGSECKATENHTFAFGYNTLASAPGSVALGDETKATNVDAFTIGYQTHANGWGSAVFGNGTIANSYAAVVLGRFNDTTTMTNKNWYVSSDPAFIIGNGTSNADRKNAFTVLQNANVGINMVNPQQKLDIAGGNGRVESGYSWLTNSDIRYKKNISTLESSLEKVLHLRGVRYDLNEEPLSPADQGKHIGFIAQELENVVPEVVVTGSDGYKSVAYDKLTAVLTEAIKEQQKQIEMVKEVNQQLKSELEMLKTLVNTLIANQTTQINK